MLAGAHTVGHVSAATGRGKGGDADGGDGDGCTMVEKPETLDAIVDATASRSNGDGMLPRACETGQESGCDRARCSPMRSAYLYSCRCRAARDSVDGRTQIEDLHAQAREQR
eukprot:6200360-Pleurochrysis_carterae.AAC.1